MKELSQSFQAPVDLRIREIISCEETCNFPLTNKDLFFLFQKQAELDISGDDPRLSKDSKFLFTPKGLYLYTPYTIADKNNLEKRVGLTFKGFINNDSRGFLSDETKIEIVDTDDLTINRVFKSFKVKGSLPIKTFLKSMFEEALKPGIEINEMSLSDNCLVLELEATSTNS